MPLNDICGARAGSNGILGEIDIPLRFPSAFTELAVVGTGAAGGEYCVPTSAVLLTEDFVLAAVDKERLCALGGAIGT